MTTENPDLRALVAKTLGVEPPDLGEDPRLGTPPWTSLAHVHVLAELGATYGFALTPELVQELTSLRALQRFVEERQR